ncbi:hypothetical protein AYI70_g10134 [Smittium culicis]|uniref:Uncharacterized protein n=1 Tax=Smittium culicis TaxID=133412 RepID=A0A1R1X7Y7_9FUNG|nr:hypothetical protein AYI70_g10134 [Smittium culicis]
MCLKSNSFDTLNPSTLMPNVQPSYIITKIEPVNYQTNNMITQNKDFKKIIDIFLNYKNDYNIRGINGFKDTVTKTSDNRSSLSGYCDDINIENSDLDEILEKFDSFALDNSLEFIDCDEWGSEFYNNAFLDSSNDNEVDSIRKISKSKSFQEKDEFEEFNFEEICFSDDDFIFEDTINNLDDNSGIPAIRIKKTSPESSKIKHNPHKFKNKYNTPFRSSEHAVSNEKVWNSIQSKILGSAKKIHTNSFKACDDFINDLISNSPITTDSSKKPNRSFSKSQKILDPLPGSIIKTKSKKRNRKKNYNSIKKFFESCNSKSKIGILSTKQASSIPSDVSTNHFLANSVFKHERNNLFIANTPTKTSKYNNSNKAKPLLQYGFTPVTNLQTEKADLKISSPSKKIVSTLLSIDDHSLLKEKSKPATDIDSYIDINENLSINKSFFTPRKEFLDTRESNKINEPIISTTQKKRKMAQAPTTPFSQFNLDLISKNNCSSNTVFFNKKPISLDPVFSDSDNSNLSSMENSLTLHTSDEFFVPETPTTINKPSLTPKNSFNNTILQYDSDVVPESTIYDSRKLLPEYANDKDVKDKLSRFLSKVHNPVNGSLNSKTKNEKCYNNSSPILSKTSNINSSDLKLKSGSVNGIGDDIEFHIPSSNKSIRSKKSKDPG